MKRLLTLWQVAAEELAARCHTSTTQDYKTVLSRFEHEGLSFLTITLPRFGEDFQKSLAVERVDRNLFQGFTWKGGLPRFMGGFLDLVFDRGTGQLLESPEIEAIYAIRQLSLMFGKIHLPCTDARVAAAIEGYLECEKEVRKYDSERTEDDYLAFTRMSRLLWSDVFTRVDRKVYTNSLLPKHGPGATADRLKGNRKYEQREWTQRLEAVFPYGEYVIPNWRYHSYLDHVHFLEPGAERPVRVITVPKTLKTPRIIAIEPTAMQYMQQAVSRDLVDIIESGDSRFGWCLGFASQACNQRLACRGSRSGSLATLDLSEASDRVSNQLVRRMLAPHPWLAEGVDACRSRKADVPTRDGSVTIRLAKFASMGSALTFPMEAMVFAVVVFLGIERALNCQLTPELVQSFKGQVRIYGDDIIVPTDMVESVVESLRTFGFKVNLGKSFWTGSFRESCGKEYYDGHDVSIVRVRELIPTRRKDVAEVVSTVSLRNQLYMAGLWRTAALLDRWLGKVLKHYPTVSQDSSVLGRVSVIGFDIDGIDGDLQIPLVRGYKVRARLPENPLDGVFALHKVLLSEARKDAYGEDVNPGWHQNWWDLYSEPAVDAEHLVRSGRPERVDIKLSWAPAMGSSYGNEVLHPGVLRKKTPYGESLIHAKRESLAH